MVLLGVGAGLAIPSTTASVMRSLPRQHTGVGGATNGTFPQVGGALGVAVIGSLLITHYQDQIDQSCRRRSRRPPATRHWDRSAAHNTPRRQDRRVRRTHSIMRTVWRS